MGYIVSDKQFLNENIFKFEQRLESQYSIFTEKNPTFVTYYHINNINSITDTGLQNVDRVLGRESPLRYQEIKDFPIYGIDQIKLDLSDEDEGLTSNFESDGIILPNTVKPLPNDFFIISYLGDNFLFIVTSIDYDTIKSNNYYKINFALRSNDLESIEDLHNQTLEKYSCIFANIGTEDNCLIQEDAYVQLEKLQKVYASLIEKYKSLFYNKRYNSFVFNSGGTYIYDKFMTNFINNGSILNRKNDYSTIELSNEDYGEQFDTTYELSIYKSIEDLEIDNLDYIRYILCPITYPHSIFKYYNAEDVKSLVFIPKQAGGETYIPDEIIDKIHGNNIEDLDIAGELIVRYFNKNIESIFQIDLDKLTKYKIKYTLYNFIMIPIVLYILKYYNNKFLRM